jgi:hypothetical protein
VCVDNGMYMFYSIFEYFYLPGFAFLRADLSRGLSTAEVRWRVAQSSDAGGCCRLLSSFDVLCEDLPLPVFVGLPAS